jgi:hypothetical protein
MTVHEWETYYGWDVIGAGREWIADVVSNPEDVDDADSEDVFRFIRRNYSGGWSAFVADMRPEDVR